MFPHEQPGCACARRLRGSEEVAFPDLSGSFRAEICGGVRLIPVGGSGNGGCYYLDAGRRGRITISSQLGGRLAAAPEFGVIGFGSGESLTAEVMQLWQERYVRVCPRASRVHVLVSSDDGSAAPGVAALLRAVRNHPVIPVVRPSQSVISNTVRRWLTLMAVIRAPGSRCGMPPQQEDQAGRSGHKCRPECVAASCSLWDNRRIAHRYESPPGGDGIQCRRHVQPGICPRPHGFWNVRNGSQRVRRSLLPMLEYVAGPLGISVNIPASGQQESLESRMSRRILVGRSGTRYGRAVLPSAG